MTLDDSSTKADPRSATVKKSLSLSTLAAAVTAIALIVVMGVYASYQHVTQGTPWAELLLAHTWHVLAITATIEVALVIVLRTAVSEPIRQVNTHLYGVATGHLDTLILPSRVDEVDELVCGVNAMIRRLEMNRDEDFLNRSQEDLTELRNLLQRLDPENSMAILRLRRLEHALLSVPRGSIHATTSATASVRSSDPMVVVG
jgi:methyl-accepting chemotaxis protein